MVCSPPIGPEIVRGSITRDRWNVTLRFSYANEVPLGQRSHFYLKIDWQPDQGKRDVDLIFNSPAGAGQIVFNDQNGNNTRHFSGDVEQLVAIYGKTPSAAGATDITLEVKIDDDVRHRIPLAVRPVPTPVPSATAFERLRQEMAIAALATRPTDAAQQRIWDRYTRIFEDARAIADKLGNVRLPTPSVPTIQGALTERSFNVAEIVEHLRSHRSPDGVANQKAKDRTDAFDPFKGHWRGDWRQANDCGIPVNTCQDHLWGVTEALSSNPDIYVQQVELGADSRPYTDATPARTCTAITDAGRDSTLQAINAINIKTGVIVGAVGVRSTADADGIWSQRPHVGFYVDPGTLLWVAEENRSSDGNTITYSIFYELREGDPVNQPLYTILAFDGSWNRTTQTFTPNANPKAAQYLKIMTAAERQLERQFHRDRQLQPQHRQDPYYLRQLESLDSEVLEEFLKRATNGSAEKDYLERLMDFVLQQEALWDAPLGTRERITFILGDINNDGFYQAANHYFTLNPSGNLITTIRSLYGIRNYLSRNSPQNGLPWGEVNIVVHANEVGQMITSIFDDDPTTPEDEQETPAPRELEAAIRSTAFNPLPDSIVDARTVFRIRGCALGQSEEMLRLLSQAYGGGGANRPIVRAPLLLQVYQEPLSNRADEWLSEFWFVGWRGLRNQQPNRQTLVDLFRSKYPRADVDWNRALARQIPNISQDIRDRPFTLPTVSQTYSPGDAPSVSTTEERLTLYRTLTNLDETLESIEETVDDYRWILNATTQTTSDGDIEITISGRGERTILRLDRDLRARLVPQFTLDLALQTALSSRSVTDELRSAFSDHHVPLSEQAEINILDVNRRWLIQDPGNVRSFIIQFTNNRLNVSLEQDFSPTEPVQRAHFPATDLRYFAEEVPARPAQHPLGENVQP